MEGLKRSDNIDQIKNKQIYKIEQVVTKDENEEIILNYIFFRIGIRL